MTLTLALTFDLLHADLDFVLFVFELIMVIVASGRPFLVRSVAYGVVIAPR